MFLGNRELEDRAVRLQTEDLARQDPVALDRDERPLPIRVRAGDEDLRDITDLVFDTVADQCDSVVVAPAPGHGLRSGGPDEQARPDRAPGGVGARDEDLVCAAVRRHERESRLPLPIGREGSCGNLGIDRSPRPAATAGCVLLEDVVPLTSIDGVRQRATDRSLAAPINGDYLDPDRVPGASDRSGCREADVEVAGVNDERLTAGEGLSVIPDRGSLDRQHSAARPLGGILKMQGADVARQFDDQHPVSVRPTASFQDRR